MLACAAAILQPTGAAAQGFERFTVDSAISADTFAGDNVSSRPQIVIDISAAVRLSDHWQALVRPWFRLPRPSPLSAPQPGWDTQLYQAGLRYERPGPLATRIDLGYLVSPIGLGMIDARPNLNPTIMPHFSYLVPMPPFDPTLPSSVRQPAVASSYPLGAQLTVSTDRWDARGAIVNAPPTSNYVLGSSATPTESATVEVGGGVTPIAGLRIGASAAHGAYVTADRTRTGADRSMTLVSGEVEYAVRYTKVSGEIVRTAFEAPQSAVAYAWFVEGMQTLTPRWFAAGRSEHTSAPSTPSGIRPSLSAIEVTAGYRLTPDVTLRSSYFARKFYGAVAWDRQAGASIVWARRWW